MHLWSLFLSRGSIFPGVTLRATECSSGRRFIPERRIQRSIFLVLPFGYFKCLAYGVATLPEGAWVLQWTLWWLGLQNFLEKRPSTSTQSKAAAGETPSAMGNTQDTHMAFSCSCDLHPTHELDVTPPNSTTGLFNQRLSWNSTSISKCTLSVLTFPFWFLMKPRQY